MTRPDGGPRPWPLRVLSWNVCELRGDVEALVRAVREIDPDVLLVQEAPRLVLPRTRLERFADRIGRRILVGGRGGRGLAVLGTDAVARQVIRRGMHPVRQRLTDANSTYPRGVAAVRLSVPGGGAVVVCAIHLALQEENRLRHAAHVVDLVRSAGAPVIVGGDLNETAERPARQRLGTVLHDPIPDSEWTFPARRPQRRIDGILTTAGVQVVAARAVTSTSGVAPERFREASDHLPVQLDVEVMGAGASRGRGARSGT